MLSTDHEDGCRSQAEGFPEPYVRGECMLNKRPVVDWMNMNTGDNYVQTWSGALGFHAWSNRNSTMLIVLSGL
jgi:hypothetical protein